MGEPQRLKLELALPSVSDTCLLAQAIAASCPWEQPGARVLWLEGELGAGKTTLAAALLAALGVQETVRSPTYSLVEIYQVGARVAVHVDLYRLRDSAELDPLGLSDYLRQDTLLLVEWPDRAGGALSAGELTVTLSYDSGAGRQGRIEAGGAGQAGQIWLQALASRISLPKDQTDKG